jgi:N-acetylmuramoyl-L-alanine amidase
MQSDLFKKFLSTVCVIRTMCLLFIVITVAGQGGQAFAALSPAQTQLFQENINYFNSDTCSSSSDTTNPTTTATGPTIVIDPGHGPNRTVRDTATGLNMIESDNTPEMQDVWDVANIMKKDLGAAGYNVVLTKSDINDNVTFRGRADIADKNNAALALSIHGDSSLPDPGEIFVQKVGLFRGQGSNKTTFTDAGIATKSQNFATTFQQQRQSISGSSVVIKDNSFAGRAPIETGNISMVQLFSKTPWVYNEKRMPFDGQEYAKELESSVEKSVPIGGSPASSTSTTPACSCTTTSSATLTGKDIKEQIVNYFVGKGLTMAQAAGIEGNFGQESTWNPKDSNGYLGQWSGSRLTALQALATKENKPVTDPGVQLDYTWLELTNGPGAAEDDRVTLQHLKAATTPEDAAQQFMGVGGPPTWQYGFERPGDPQLANRQKFAREIFDSMGGSVAPGGSTGSGSCASSSGSPDCKTAIGDAKIICEAKKYDPVSYSQSIDGGNHLSGGNPAWLKLCPVIGPSCYLDCSGLVNIAVYDAFGYDLKENTNGEVADTAHWKQISFGQIQPGDLIQPDPGHVEIVDHVSGQTIYTFGAHTDSVPQPDQVNATQYTNTPGYVYLHWIGHGS